MFEWVRRLMQRQKPMPEVVKAEQRQTEQFDVWDETMREVERVQRLAAGKRPAHHRAHRAHR